ncbi:MAG TPA: response regulator [Dehalococcoidia bacterium]|nr:response regulator [Dehalococcoidia bacterium]
MASRKRILVIDDSRVLASATERILQDQDYEVITAINVIDGFDKAKEEKPDAIILDILVPDIDGYEIGRVLRQHPDTNNIPIIFLCSEENIESKEGASTVGLQEINMAFECGADDFLQKPISADDLVRSVKNVIWFSEISTLA